MASKRRIQEQLKQISKPKDKMKGIRTEADNAFLTALCSYCLNNDLHINTIYMVIKNKKIQKALKQDKELAIQDYKLHANTLYKLENKEVRDNVNQCLEKVGKKYEG